MKTVKFNNVSESGSQSRKIDSIYIFMEEKFCFLDCYAVSPYFVKVHYLLKVPFQ